VTGLDELRGSIIGLLGFAATEEQMLLATSPTAERGSPRCWAARPLRVNAAVTARGSLFDCAELWSGYRTRH
jgi:hypothetical protein